MKPITIVYLDRHRQSVTAAEEMQICKDKETASRIIDVLTDNKQLQTELRQIIDNY